MAAVFSQKRETALQPLPMSAADLGTALPSSAGPAAGEVLLPRGLRPRGKRSEASSRRARSFSTLSSLPLTPLVLGPGSSLKRYRERRTLPRATHERWSDSQTPREPRRGVSGRFRALHARPGGLGVPARGERRARPRAAAPYRWERKWLLFPFSLPCVASRSADSGPTARSRGGAQARIVLRRERRGAGSAPAGCGREGRRLGRAERGGPPSGRRGESQSPRGPLAALAHLSLGPRSGEAGESPASLLGRGARSRGSRNSRPGVCFPSQNYNAPPEAIVFLLRRVVDDAAERPPGRVPWRDGEGVGRRGGLPRGVCPPAAGLSRASLGKSTWVGASKRVGIKYL